MNILASYFEGVPEQVRKSKLLVWALFLAATAFFIVGAGRATFNLGIEGWFAEDDPTIVAFDWFHHDFGSDDHLYIAYKAKDGDVFSEESLRALKGIHDDLRARMLELRPGGGSALGHVVKVSSLINAPVLRAEGDALISKDLVGERIPTSAEESDRIRRTAESQELFPLRYFSRDHRYGGIIIETDFGAIPVESAGSNTDLTLADLSLDIPTEASGTQERPRFKPTVMDDYLALMGEIKTVLDKPEYAAHFEYYPVGNTAATEYNYATLRELGALNLAMLVVMIGLLWILFRSLSAVVWPVVIVVLSVIWTCGITAWLGLEFTLMFSIVVMLTLAIGIADTVHVMSSYLSGRAAGRDHAAALRAGFRHVGLACLLTTVTNVVAVMALNIAPIIPVKVLALQCALGIALPFFFSVYLLPLMLDLWAPKAVENAGAVRPKASISRFIPDISTVLRRALENLLPAVERRAVLVIVSFATMFALCVYGAMQTKVDTNPIGAFPEDAKIRESVRIVDTHMAGAQSMEIYLDLGEEGAFHDPFVLNTVDALQKKIEKKYSDLVVRATSLADTVKNSHRALNLGREEMYIIPDTARSVSQTLFMFNQSNPEDRRKLVSDNYDKSHISVQLYNAGSYEYTQAWNAMRHDIDEAVQRLKQKYPETNVAITGMLALLMQGADYLTQSELAAFGVALVFVSVILFMLFGSLKAGAIALVPNLIPALLAYGGLGLLDKPVDFTTMMIAPIIIGIAVDDTIHFLMRYRSEVTVDGDINRALRATILGTGQSIVFTTLVLGLGFGVMAFASDVSTTNIGVFGSLAILVGLLNDLLLLPALIIVFKLTFRGHSMEPPLLFAADPVRTHGDA